MFFSEQKMSYKATLFLMIYSSVGRLAWLVVVNNY